MAGVGEPEYGMFEVFVLITRKRRYANTDNEFTAIDDVGVPLEVKALPTCIAPHFTWDLKH